MISQPPLRSFLRDDDLTPQEQAEVLDLALKLKTDRYSERPLAGPQSVAIIFDKPTLRTQLSFMAGVSELGGFPLVIDGKLAQIGTRESVADTARVLARQVSAIVWRTFMHDLVEELAQVADVPVVNALSDSFHPCQILADLLTLRERFGSLSGRSLAYLGDAANNMANSYLLGCATAGMHVRIAGPHGHLPPPELVTRAEEIAARTGGSVSITSDAVAAVSGADAVATDTWVSMGMESDADSRRGQASPFAPYRVDDTLMAHAAADAVFLHCLPAYRGYEVTESVIDGPRSVVWDEAENRLHAQKALLAFLLRSRR